MRAGLVVAALLAPAGLVASAWGQPAGEGNAAVAEALFRHGRELLDAGKVSEACEKFAASQKADPALGTLLNLAACHERDGRTATAWSEFTDALAEATRLRDKRASYAQSRITALEKTLYRVVIEVADPPADLLVRLDGQPLGREALGTPLPVNPGQRTVEASAPGRASWSTKIAVPRTAGQQRIEIPALAALTPGAPAVAEAPRAVPPPVVVAPPKPVVPVAAAPEPGEHARLSRRAVALMVGSGGVIGVAAGSIYGLVAKSRNDDAKSHCQGTVCDARGVSLNHGAKSAATISTVAFGVGLVGLAAGGWLFFAEPTESGVSLAPVLTAEGGGLSLGGRF